MKKLKSKLSNLCYFKKITRAERLKLLSEFEGEVNFKTADDSLPRADVGEIYQTYRNRVITSYKADKYKIYLLVINLLIALCSILTPILFLDSSSSLFGVIVYFHYVLYPVLFVSILVGLVMRKVNVREYKYHLVAFAAQIILTSSALMFVLYKVAGALAAF